MKAAKDYEQAKTQTDKDYEELTAAADKKASLTDEQKADKAVAESLKELRASPDYELCQLAEQKPGVPDDLAAERVKQLEIENAELESQAERLAIEIKQLDGTGRLE